MANSRSRTALAMVSLIAAFAAAGGLSYLGARAATDFLEARTEADVAQAMQGAGYDWVRVEANGLQLRLTGTAPDEVQRFRAKSQAETVVDSSRVIDNIQVAARALLGTPDFTIELLRNDGDISVLGLVPASVDRAAMIAALRRGSGVMQVDDLLEVADYPEPQGWDAAFDFGLEAARLTPRAKISIGPGTVQIRAATDSEAEKLQLEGALKRAQPGAVRLVAEITAPRPVIAPFALRFVKDERGARFDACSADSDASLTRILAAGTKAGIPGKPACRLGIGAPSSAWAEVAEAGIRAVAAMQAGSVSISDTRVVLFAPETVLPGAFDEAVGRLESSLPEPFTLTSEHEKKSDTPGGPAEFSAELGPEGVTLRGRIGDERMRNALESLARSRFDKVDDALRLDSTLPTGWTLRSIAAIEALAALDHGKVTVTPRLITLEGVSGNKAASDVISASLSRRLGEGIQYELSVRYDRRLDPLVQLPSGTECVDALNAVMHESAIGFEPAKAVIAGDPRPSLERLALAMADCGDYRIEIGGHTDAQGSEELNAELSQGRARAVLAAMRDHGIGVAQLIAKGYGASQPIADNDTEEGREANRRIEFTLLSEQPVTLGQAGSEKNVSGVTDTAEVTASRLAELALTAATGAVRAVLEPAEGKMTAAGVEPPAAAGSGGNAAVTDPDVLARIIEALTVPAVEAVFPEDPEDMPASEDGTGQDGSDK